MGLFLLLVTLFVPGMVVAEALYSTFDVLAVDPASNWGVLRLSNGQIRLFRVGDAIGESGLLLLEVLADRILVNGLAREESSQAPRMLRAWIHLLDLGKGRSRFDPLDSLSPGEIDLSPRPMAASGHKTQDLPNGSVLKTSLDPSAALETDTEIESIDARATTRSLDSGLQETETPEDWD